MHDSCSVLNLWLQPRIRGYYTFSLAKWQLYFFNQLYNASLDSSSLVLFLFFLLLLSFLVVNVIKPKRDKSILFHCFFMVWLGFILSAASKCESRCYGYYPWLSLTYEYSILPCYSQDKKSPFLSFWRYKEESPRQKR